MTVALALHTVGPKIRKDAETADRVHATHLRRDLPQPVQQATIPHLQLAVMLFGHDEKHYWDPGKPIHDDNDVIVQVPDLGRLLSSYDPAEYAVISCAQLSVALAPLWMKLEWCVPAAGLVNINGG